MSVKKFEQYWAKRDAEREAIRKHNLVHALLARESGFGDWRRDCARAIADARGLVFVDWNKASPALKARAMRDAKSHYVYHDVSAKRKKTQTGE